MNPATRHRIFSAVPIWLWPYLWLQLWGLQRWIRATGRGLLIAVCPRTGNVYITRICAACPGILRAHFVDRPRPAHALAPPFADTS